MGPPFFVIAASSYASAHREFRGATRLTRS
jgi:hypothetical protein